MATDSNESGQNNSGFKIEGAIKVLAILFVIVVYMVIFLKILFLQ